MRRPFGPTCGGHNNQHFRILTLTYLVHKMWYMNILIPLFLWRNCERILFPPIRSAPPSDFRGDGDRLVLHPGCEFLTTRILDTAMLLSSLWPALGSNFHRRPINLEPRWQTLEELIECCWLSCCAPSSTGPPLKEAGTPCMATPLDSYHG